MGGPCSSWVSVEDAQADPAAQTQDGGAISDAVMAEACSVASEILWALSGRQFSGVCVDTVRPLRRYYNADDLGAGWWWWSLWRWQGDTYLCSRPPDRAGGWSALSEITLGAYPIREILSVYIDGAVVDPAKYRLDDERWLVWIDPNDDGWPATQNLAADPLTDVGTFQVTFAYGQLPPDAGVMAARRLAIELAKASCGDPCALPDRVLNISQQGMSYVLLDPMLFLDKGRTGIYLVDLFLAAVNPQGLARRPMVISPDIPRPVRRAGTREGS